MKKLYNKPEIEVSVQITERILWYSYDSGGDGGDNYEHIDPFA